jgi:hypothetical protein
VAQARAAWRTDPDGVGGIGPERLVFLDECGVLTNMARLHGRSPRGTRACASACAGSAASEVALHDAFGQRRDGREAGGQEDQAEPLLEEFHGSESLPSRDVRRVSVIWLTRAAP